MEVGVVVVVWMMVSVVTTIKVLEGVWGRGGGEEIAVGMVVVVRMMASVVKMIMVLEGLWGIEGVVVVVVRMMEGSVCLP